MYISPNACARAFQIAIAAAGLVVTQSASAAIIAINFVGVTSSAEGAYLRHTDFLAGTSAYLNGPIYTDEVNGSLLIDTSKLPALDPFELDQGHFTFRTAPPTETFVTGRFSSNGYFPVGSAGDGGNLTFPVSIPDYAGVSAVDRLDWSSTASEVDSFGNTVVRSIFDSEDRVITFAWGDPLPLTLIGGVLLPDFSQIRDAAFGSYSIRNRYVVDETYAPDGAILTRNQLAWTLTHGQSAGIVTSVSVQVSDIPEPTTWSMMIVGFGLLGLSMRARNKGVRLVR